jgi:hypothetical protein
MSMTALPEAWHRAAAEERDRMRGHEKAIESNNLLRLDSAAVRTRDRVAEAYQRAGKTVPEVHPWDDAPTYQKRAVNGLKDVIGVPNTDIARGVPDHALPALVDAVVQKVGETWMRPHDLAPNESRTVAVADRTGRQVLNEVFGAGTPSPFRLLYADCMQQPQLATSIGGQPVNL